MMYKQQIIYELFTILYRKTIANLLYMEAVLKQK